MKRIGVLMILALAAAIPAHADPAFTASGTILISDPGSRVLSGVAEQGSPCNGSIDPEDGVPDGLAQGTDGFWVQLPAGLGGHSATLTAADPNDVDAWFYDDGCNLIKPAADANAYSMASTGQAPDGNESGIIPTDAAWVAVDLYVGAAATFTLTVN